MVVVTRRRRRHAVALSCYLELEETGVPFNSSTGIRVYQNMFQSLALWRITTHLTWVMTNPPRRGMSVTVSEISFK